MAFFQFFIPKVSKWIGFVALGVGAGANIVGAEVEVFPNTGVQVSKWIEFLALDVKTGANTVGVLVEVFPNTGVQVSKLIGFIAIGVGTSVQGKVASSTGVQVSKLIEFVVSSACAGVESGANGTIVSASLSTLQESSKSSFRAFSRGYN